RQLSLRRRHAIPREDLLCLVFVDFHGRYWVLGIGYWVLGVGCWVLGLPSVLTPNTQYPIPNTRSCLFLVLLPQCRDNGGVGESGGVAEGAALGDVAEETAHDLAAAGLGQLGREEDVVRA